MNIERTRHGILIGEKYLSAPEALDLLERLLEEQDSLVIASKEELPASGEIRRETEWTAADEERIASEDEQIMRL